MNQVRTKPPVISTYDGNVVDNDKFKPRRCIIVDLDGTTCDNKHRQHHMVGAKKNWKAFFDAIPGDTLVPEIKWMIDLVFRHTDVGIILATGRPSQTGDMTKEWLASNGVPYTYLMMRAEGDGTSDSTCKKNMLKSIREMGFDPFLCIDDRPEVVAMWRENGVPVWQPDATDWYKQQTVETPLLQSLECIRGYAGQLPDCEEAMHIRNHTIAIGQHIDTLTHTIREQRDELERLRGTHGA